MKIKLEKYIEHGTVFAYLTGMSKVNDNKAGERTQPSDLVPAGIYRGHNIEIENVRQGVQNVYIDGAISGWIIFPTIAFNYARQLIDARN